MCGGLLANMNVKVFFIVVLLSAIATAISGVDLDQTCTETADCTTQNAECTGTLGSKTCACSGNFKKDNNLCVAEKNLNDGCTASNECPTHAECADDNGTDKCKCSSGFKAVSTNCVAIKNLGQSCTNTADCTTQNAECTGTDGSKTCACSGGFKKDNELCVAEKNLDAVCSASNECPTNAECVDDSNTKKCKCSSGFKVDSTNCVAIKKLSESCSVTNDCSDIDHAVCTATKCACEDTYTPKEGACVQAVSQISCTAVGKQCDIITNAECDTAPKVLKCKCKSGFTENLNQCQEKSGAVSTTTFIGMVFFPLMVLLSDKLFM